MKNRLIAYFLILSITFVVASPYNADPTPDTGDGELELLRKIAKSVDDANTAGGGGATSTGADNWTVTVGTSSTASALALAEQTTRRIATFTNEDTTIIQYIRESTVSSDTGKKVLPLQSVSIGATGPIYVISASGTPSYSIISEYDN